MDTIIHVNIHTANPHDLLHLVKSTYEEFRRKMGYIHCCQFEIFAIEAAEI